MTQPGSSIPLDLRTRSSDRLRRTLQRLGGFDVWRRWQASNRLTVLLLHRIVPDRAASDPHDCLTVSLFESVLRLLSRQYNFIELPKLLAWLDVGAPLPDRPLLLTFDDGWGDTALVALPVLRRAGVPAAVFIATDAVADEHPVWWQEASRLERPADTAGMIGRLCSLAEDPSARARLLARHSERNPEPDRQMLRPEELPTLSRSNVAIGAHSAAHLPLTRLTDEEVVEDLARSRRALSAWLTDDPQAQGIAVRCLAFPHGRWDARVVALARRAGFDVFFSSEPCLNRLQRGQALPFGRIQLSAASIAGPDGRLAPDRLATWLLARATRSSEAGPP